MGSRERNPRMYLKWPGLHTAPTPRKIRKTLDRLQNIKRFTKKTPMKVKEKLAGSLQHASFVIPGGVGLFLPIQVVLKGTIQWLRITPDLTKYLQDWGGDYKKHVSALSVAD